MSGRWPRFSFRVGIAERLKAWGCQPGLHVAERGTLATVHPCVFALPQNVPPAQGSPRNTQWYPVADGHATAVTRCPGQVGPPSRRGRPRRYLPSDRRRKVTRSPPGSSRLAHDLSIAVGNPCHAHPVINACLGAREGVLARLALAVFGVRSWTRASPPPAPRSFTSVLTGVRSPVK